MRRSRICLLAATATIALAFVAVERRRRDHPRPPATRASDRVTPHARVARTNGNLPSVAPPEDAVPPATLAAALAAADPAQRDAALLAAVQRWAETAPRPALQWALAQRTDLRAAVVNAALLGAARQPAVAVALGREHFGGESPEAHAFGLMLLGALGRANAFTAAVAWAADAPASRRVEWIDFAFAHWGAAQPEVALRAAAALDAPPLRDAAVHALIRDWAEKSPAELAACVPLLPRPGQQAYARAQLAPRWLAQDPPALARWLAAQPPSPELDESTALLLTRTDAANRSAAVALAWAERIHDPGLRARTIAQITTPPTAPRD